MGTADDAEADMHAGDTFLSSVDLPSEATIREGVASGTERLHAARQRGAARHRRARAYTFTGKDGKDKEGKGGKKWLFRKTSGNGKDDKGAGGEDDVEGMRVDFYLVVFLKFIASIVPTIEVDSTTSF